MEYPVAETLFGIFAFGVVVTGVVVMGVHRARDHHRKEQKVRREQSPGRFGQPEVSAAVAHGKTANRR